MLFVWPKKKSFGSMHFYMNTKINSNALHFHLYKIKFDNFFFHTFFFLNQKYTSCGLQSIKKKYIKKKL